MKLEDAITKIGKKKHYQVISHHKKNQFTSRDEKDLIIMYGILNVHGQNFWFQFLTFSLAISIV